VEQRKEKSCQYGPDGGTSQSVPVRLNFLGKKNRKDYYYGSSSKPDGARKGNRSLFCGNSSSPKGEKGGGFFLKPSLLNESVVGGRSNYGTKYVNPL